MTNIYKYGEYQFCMALLSLYSSLMFLHINQWAWLVLSASIALVTGVKINGRWQCSPHVRLAGSFASAHNLITFHTNYFMGSLGQLNE